MKFSIISTILNEEKWIGETIRSVINQNIDFEYLIIDAGSTDSTLEIIESFKDNRIKLFFQRFGYMKDLKESLYGNLNLGLDKMTGDIFVILAGHQPLCDNALKVVSENIGDSEWLIGGFQKVNDSGKIIKTFSKPELTTPFIKSEFVKKNNLRFSTNYIQGDYEFYRKIWSLVGEPKRVSEILHQYVITSNNLFLTNRSKMKEEIKELKKIYG